MVVADLLTALLVMMVIALVLMVVVIAQLAILIQRENSEAEIRTYIAKILTQLNDRMK